jgi:methionyl-tRNA formyltransferase
MNNYVVATVKEWNIDQFNNSLNKLPGCWHLITEEDSLNINILRELSPKYIFFPHWSWIVPKSILDEFECVCFHMTDVPYGRGGSPLQNLIIRGHKETKLTALKMVDELDAGPIYMQESMSLLGSAQEIFNRSSTLSFEMIQKIITIEPKTVEQIGDIVQFKRRTPAESEIPLNSATLEHLYNLVRMLDADTYPKAYLNYGDYRLEFSNATLKDSNALKASITITKRVDT